MFVYRIKFRLDCPNISHLSAIKKSDENSNSSSRQPINATIAAIIITATTSAMVAVAMPHIKMWWEKERERKREREWKKKWEIRNGLKAHEITIRWKREIFQVLVSQVRNKIKYSTRIDSLQKKCRFPLTHPQHNRSISQTIYCLESWKLQTSKPTETKPFAALGSLNLISRLWTGSVCTDEAWYWSKKDSIDLEHIQNQSNEFDWQSTGWIEENRTEN